jgi:hypothetical protein
MPFEVFQIPITLRNQLIEFQARQQCHHLEEIEDYKEEFRQFPKKIAPSCGVGILARLLSMDGLEAHPTKQVHF